jgi:hypothetical protein
MEVRIHENIQYEGGKEEEKSLPPCYRDYMLLCAQRFAQSNTALLTVLIQYRRRASALCGNSLICHVLTL